MRMLEAVQPFIDTSISKTVNVPADYPFEDFKALYHEAWKASLKGIATYRPNAVTGSVLSVEPAESILAATNKEYLDNLREEVEALKKIDANISQRLAGNGFRRWDRRPSFPAGVPSRTFATKRNGQYVAVHVSLDDTNTPFEVWVSGEGCDPTIGALTMVLSLLMQSTDTRPAQKMLDKLSGYHTRDGDFFEWNPQQPDKKR